MRQVACLFTAVTHVLSVGFDDLCQSTVVRQVACIFTAVTHPLQWLIQRLNGTQEPWYAVVANADFMLHDVQNESFAEQLRERRRLYREQKKEVDFFLVPEPAWLEESRVPQASRVRRPSLAVVSQDKQWITCAPG